MHIYLWRRGTPNWCWRAGLGPTLGCTYSAETISIAVFSRESLTPLTSYGRKLFFQYSSFTFLGIPGNIHLQGRGCSSSAVSEPLSQPLWGNPPLAADPPDPGAATELRRKGTFTLSLRKWEPRHTGGSQRKTLTFLKQVPLPLLNCPQPAVSPGDTSSLWDTSQPPPKNGTRAPSAAIGASLRIYPPGSPQAGRRRPPSLSRPTKSGPRYP